MEGEEARGEKEDKEEGMEGATARGREGGEMRGEGKEGQAEEGGRKKGSRTKKRGR